MKSAALKDYRRKRRFEATPEPGPALVEPRRAGRRFCVQEHRATRLHYDLRLEMEGVLRSWAVPKGPTLDPEVRRLALATEDHPLEYLTFEGEIPQGNYGAGEVIVWDLGEYEPVGEAAPVQQWERGHLKFVLHGRKLNGEFSLVRTGGRGGEGKRDEKEEKQKWLLIKARDGSERFGDIAEQHPGSVLKPRAAQPHTKIKEMPARAVPASKPKPMLATLGERPFRSPDWVFEIKWDGIRALARRQGDKVTLISRTGRDVTAQYPELQRFGDGLPGADLVMDGEIVALDAEGKSSFHRLQQRMNLADASDIARAAAAIPVDYYAFDLLALGGRDLTQQPLIERKRQLAGLGWKPPWRYSDHVANDGIGFYDLARGRGLEGIVAKRADSHYEAGRSRRWLKFKLQRTQDAAIVGYTDPRGARTEFGALLLAVWDGAAGAFAYAGRVGTGFDAATRRGIRERLSAAAAPAVSGAPGAGVHWTRPELVAEVKFAEWTPAGHLRAPVFLGLREDKLPRECIREGSGA